MMPNEAWSYDRMMGRVQQDARDHDRRQRPLQWDAQSVRPLVVDTRVECPCGWRGARLLKAVHDAECPLSAERILREGTVNGVVRSAEKQNAGH